jgi:hypothetical protein
MDEQVRMGVCKTVEKSSRTSPVSEEAFELSAHPANKIPIDVVPNTTKCRGIETPKVGVPASQNWIENPRKVQQSILVLQLDTPVVDASVNLFYRITTNRRKKIRMNLTFRINTSSGTKSIVEKVEADSWIIFSTIGILTINDTRFVGMDFQPTLPEPF